MITNPRRKKRIQDFVDKNHRVMGDYYEALDEIVSEKKLKMAMKNFIKKNPNYYGDLCKSPFQ